MLTDDNAPQAPTERTPMATQATLRNRYVSASVETMSPGRAIVALYDRLVLDLDRAIAALTLDNVGTAHTELLHAQDIVAELHLALDLKQWPQGTGLAALYRFLHGELIVANVDKDPARVAACREIVVPLRDAWRQAAGVTPIGGGDAAA
jgi:flagellar protein FliS